MLNYNASHRRGDMIVESNQKHLQRKPNPNSDPRGSKQVNTIQQKSEKSRVPLFAEPDENDEEGTPNNLKIEHPGVSVYNDSGAGKRIDITSKHLREAIAKVNKRALAKPATEIFTEQEPFPTLFYHIDDVRNEIAKLNDDEANRDLHHLDLILSDMEPLWNRAHEENFGSGFASYDMLWKLYQPGELVLHEDELGNIWQFCFITIRYREENIDRDRKVHEKQGNPKYALISAWGLGWENLEECLTRKHFLFRLEWFSGQVPITSIFIYPKSYYGSRSIEKLNKFLSQRGQDWWGLVTSRSSCLNYDGIAFHYHKSEAGPSMAPLWERSKISERVVIDIKAKDMWHLKTSNGGIVQVRQRNDVAEDDQRERYKWDNLPATTCITEEQAGLCPAIIGCHSLSTMESYIVRVDKLVPVVWDGGAMDHLVLEKRKKDILKGLVGQHYNNRKNESMGDLIKDKGKGLVILLHGPPGVGKTLTAECISEAVQRPLISLSIGNLVWEEKKLQERLKEEFDRATRWDAILLLDEADVVLEARSFEDVRRNGMVSVFLRQLEYYQGVLFLTSNRVSTMDVAFQSRIQIGISFKNMAPAIRSQIWEQLLALNGRDKIIGPEAVENVKQKLGKFELNGRQIRNVLNVADGLAFNEYGESGKLKYSHIREAVESAVEFQNMLEDARSSMKNEQTVWAMYRGGDD